MANWFEPAALFIMFREALEAAVIIAVLLQLMNKLNMRHLKRYVWIGALGGLVISIIIGVVFIIVFYVANTKIFSGNGELIFKGVIQWIASLMITVVAFAMLKFYNLERKWRYKLEKGVSAEALTSTRSQKWTIILLAGSATLREGIESVLFLTGVSAGEGIRAIWIPGLVGIALGLLAGVLLFYSGKPIKSLRWFFILSCCLLLLISSGLVVSGLGNFQAAGLFGPLYPYEARPWANRITWDTSACCSQTDNKFWAIINALFGYQDQPTNLMLLYYCLYWAIVLTLLFYKWWRGTLTDRREAELPSFRQHSDGSLSMSKMASAKLSDDSSAALGVDPEEGREGAEEGGSAGSLPEGLSGSPKDSAATVLSSAGGDGEGVEYSGKP